MNHHGNTGSENRMRPRFTQELIDDREPIVPWGVGHINGPLYRTEAIDRERVYRTTAWEPPEVIVQPWGDDYFDLAVPNRQ